MEQNPEDVAVDTNTEVEETTNSSESGAEETTDLAVENENLRKALAQNNARAKRAEEELKKFKSTPTPSQTINNNNPDISEELKLIARGLSDEEINQAKVIAKGKGIVLTEAIKDPMFLTAQKDIKEKERREQARLGGSKGSSESEEDTLIKPDMTREEHMAAFKKVNG
jgi:hypothetical protein